MYPAMAVKATMANLLGRYRANRKHFVQMIFHKCKSTDELYAMHVVHSMHTNSHWL